MTERELDKYRAAVGCVNGRTLSRADAWDDMADAYGWEPEDNPYRESEDA